MSLLRKDIAEYKNRQIVMYITSFKGHFYVMYGGNPVRRTDPIYVCCDEWMKQGRQFGGLTFQEWVDRTLTDGDHERN